MTRTKTAGASIGNIARARIANRARAALFLRIRADGSTERRYTRDTHAVPRPACGVDRRHLREEPGAPRERLRHVGARSFARLSRPWASRSGRTSPVSTRQDVPAILVEMGFMTNPTEDRLLASAAYQRRAAIGLCRGTLHFLDRSVAPVSVTAEERTLAQPSALLLECARPRMTNRLRSAHDGASRTRTTRRRPTESASRTRPLVKGQLIWFWSSKAGATLRSCGSSTRSPTCSCGSPGSRDSSCTTGERQDFPVARSIPNLETRARDLLTVLDTIRSSRTVLFGERTTGAAFALFAASSPNRVASLVWNRAVATATMVAGLPVGLPARRASRRGIGGGRRYGELELGRAWLRGLCAEPR